MARILAKLKKIRESIRKNSKLWGFGFYGWLSLLGMLYARSYYQSFEINIFNFVELSDFLLIAISKAGIVLGIGLGIGLILVLVTLIFRFGPPVIIFILFLIALIRFLILLITFSIVHIIRSLLSLLLILITLLFRLLAQSIKSFVFLAYYTIIDSPGAWGTFTASRREGKPFTVSFRATWDTFTVSRREGKTFTQWLRTEWEKLTSRLDAEWNAATSRLDTEWNAATSRLDTAKALHRSAREKCKSLFWHFLYVPVTGMLIFGTFFMPTYHGEQDACDLVGDSQINQFDRIPVISPIYGKISSVYSEGANCLQGMFLSASPEEDSQQEPKHVRVTIRQDAVQPKTRLPKPDRTFLVGTTSSFHFFYECENDLTVGNAPECKNGRPFITPSANIASLDFIQNRPPHVTEAITQLDTTINALKFEMISVPAAITQINQVITSINTKNREGNTNIGQIENPDPESFIAPEQIISVVTTFKSYLEDRTKAKIYELNAKIATFNSTGVQNHCASGLGKIATIGPFPQGQGRLEGAAKEIKEKCQDQLVAPDQFATLDRFFCQMNKHFTNHKMLQHLMLIGRVDSEPLNPDALQFYGSQINLAQARASWVQGELLKRFPTQISHERITSLNDNYREENKGDARRALDRTVEVYACWTPKDSE